MAIRADVIVLGAGMVGVGAALALQAHRCRPAGIELCGNGAGLAPDHFDRGDGIGICAQHVEVQAITHRGGGR